jgi:DNA-directed RNA polymerase specialized sigma24 family protein
MRGGIGGLDQMTPFGKALPVLLDCVPGMSGDASSFGFKTTSWSMVLAAGVEPGSRAEPALAALCQQYWRPVYAFIRRNGHSSDRAQDLTQAFFTVLLEKNYLRDARQERGRFRSFLLTAVKHFLSNQKAHEQALKRGGGQPHISIDPAEGESCLYEVVDGETPEHVFERRWALSLLEQVMARLRAEYEKPGKVGQFDLLSPFLNGDADVDYETAAAQAGRSAGSLRTAVHRLRHRYRTLLREEIAETVAKPEEIDEEIRFLLKIFAEDPGRVR